MGDAADGAVDEGARQPLHLALAGASGDNGNLGVSALMHSVVAAAARWSHAPRVTVFDNGFGARSATTTAAGRRITYQRCGLRLSRRVHRRESLWNVRASTRLGGLGNPASAALLGADAVLDVSGGDSFTDLYGRQRFRTILGVKRAALEAGTPLVLLPQTYGPFTSRASATAAADVLLRSRLALARDERSYEAMATLLDGHLDPARHRLGVDMAFALETHEPPEPIRDQLLGWRAGVDAPVAGVNVSGLLCNDPHAPEAYGLRADYRRAVVDLVRELVADGAAVLLVCHVLSRVGSVESDLAAATAVIDALEPEVRRRVLVAPTIDDPCQTKWVVAATDWFVGARMHATIAALSSRVPAAAIAYSPKTAGVFESCGQGARVADARTTPTEALVEELLASWRAREATRTELERSVPPVVSAARAQMEELFADLAPVAEASR